MVILFAPSEGKKEGGILPPINSESYIFPELYSKRLEVVKAYETLVREGSDERLVDLFGIKNIKEFERYKTPLREAPTMKAIERYDGVAYDYLQYKSLERDAQAYVDNRVILFSNLFGPIRARDPLPDYKLKQGSLIGSLVPEKHYKEYFSNVLDRYIGDQEVLDLRAGFYDKFYVPKNKTTTLKFLKEGKVVSHWAKAYRGVILREAATHRVETIEELLALQIEGLMFSEIREMKRATEIVYTIF
ncbi:MAG: YaaA family protein [Sulfuricurvum sp.]|jgi:hypothetical protein|uniref:YaaA family protein n=1 Tax=Sulfuricurvum sp. TaxID=2025608 RepID=UPI0025D2F28A|nr:peroxide stress protein YaaA [Sulfuricurvum sp.]MCK9374150.1 YaaA family protein [Sulfuricurvum sp.]